MSNPTPLYPGAAQAELCGQTVWLDPAGAMFLPSESLLVVSDLHFEKGSHYGTRGQFLPPYDTRATLRAVAAAISRYRPARVLSLGDTFHDPQAERRMAPDDRQALKALCEACDWLFVLGNHDPLPPRDFRGEVHEEVTIAGLRFTHEPEGGSWNVAGHLHPCAAVSREGRRIRRSSFISDGTRMILPSMGAYTGGLNVLDPAVQEVLGGEMAVYMRGQGRVYRVPPSALRPDNNHQTRSLPRLKSA